MRYVYIPYAILLALFSFTVYQIQNSNEIVVSVDDNKNEDKDVIKVKPVNMTLIVSTEDYKQQYTQKMFNTDSIEDFLNTLRAEKGFTYEKYAYIYGTELDNINDIAAPEGYKWTLFSRGEDITYDIGQMNLVAGDDEYKTLELRLIQK